MKSLLARDDDIELLIVEGEQELKQALERRLTTRLTEFFLDTSFGLDMDSIIQKAVDRETVSLAIRECLAQEERITEVTSVTVEFLEDRKAKIKFKAKAREIESQIESEVVI